MIKDSRGSGKVSLLSISNETAIVIETPYNNRFFNSIEDASIRSARAIVPLVRELCPFRSVVDVGCGRGAWLSVFGESGADTIRGYDGEYVDRSTLLIPGDCFQAVDLSLPSGLSGTFDLAVCLEVAEHLPRRAAQPLVEALCRLAPIVLFSAAIPGQGGTNHINEQWPNYWAALFERQRFVRLDPIRPKIVARNDVAWWYKQNVYLFAHCDVVAGSETLRAERECSQSMDVTVIASNRLIPLLSTQGRWGEFTRGVLHSMRNRLRF